MTDERTIDERLAAYDLEPPDLEDGDDDGPAGLGGATCGCYFDSGVYAIWCNDHNPDRMIDALRAEVARLAAENIQLRAGGEMSSETTCWICDPDLQRFYGCFRPISALCAAHQAQERERRRGMREREGR